MVGKTVEMIKFHKHRHTLGETHWTKKRRREKIFSFYRHLLRQKGHFKSSRVREDECKQPTNIDANT